MTRLWCVLFIIAALLLAQAAHCAPTGLNIIPTADVLDPGVVSLQTQSIGAGTPWASEAATAVLFEIGFGKGWEAGLDHPLDDPDTWGNIKYRLWEETKARPALAVGLEAIGADIGIQPYVTAYKSFGPTRVHFGAFGVGRANIGMLGLDRPLTDRLTFQGDYLSSRNDALTYGLVFDVSSTVSLTVARVQANSADVEDTWLVNAAWTSHW
jgi:hypothetical protein